MKSGESRQCDVLVLGAFHPEIAPLALLLGDGMRAHVGTRDVAARVTGIGVSMAAAGAAMHLNDLAPRAVVLVGTCGVYPKADGGSALGIGDVAVPGWVRLCAPCIADGLAQIPEPMSVLQNAHEPTMASLIRAGGKRGDVAATLGVTVDDEAAGRLARSTNAAVEHLEAHGVATACAARGIPFAAALGVANVVGSRGRSEWRMHHRAAAAAAIDVVARWLNAG
jgi:futalosine hydrolase